MADDVLTEETLDALPVATLREAERLYREVFARWRKGMRTADAPWVEPLARIGTEVVHRAERLQRDGVLPSEEREERLTNAAIMRGVLFGWCLHRAAALALAPVLAQLREALEGALSHICGHCPTMALMNCQQKGRQDGCDVTDGLRAALSALCSFPQPEAAADLAVAQAKYQRLVPLCADALISEGEANNRAREVACILRDSLTPPPVADAMTFDFAGQPWVPCAWAGAEEDGGQWRACEIGLPCSPLQFSRNHCRLCRVRPVLAGVGEALRLLGAGKEERGGV